MENAAVGTPITSHSRRSGKRSHGNQNPSLYKVAKGSLGTAQHGSKAPSSVGKATARQQEERQLSHPRHAPGKDSESIHESRFPNPARARLKHSKRFVTASPVYSVRRTSADSSPGESPPSYEPDTAKKIKDLKAALGARDKRINALEVTVGKYRDAFRGYVKEKKQARLDKQDLESELEERQNEISDLNFKVKDLTQQLAEARLEADTYRASDGFDHDYDEENERSEYDDESEAGDEDRPMGYKGVQYEAYENGNGEVGGFGDDEDEHMFTY